MEILYQWKTDEHLLRRNTFIGDCYNAFQQKKGCEDSSESNHGKLYSGRNLLLFWLYVFYNLARNGKMPGSAQEIRYINRDENTHLWLLGISF